MLPEKIPVAVETTVIPKPASVIENEGVDALTLRQDTCLASGGQTATAELLPSALSRSYGMALKEGEEGWFIC